MLYALFQRSSSLANRRESGKWKKVSVNYMVTVPPPTVKDQILVF